MADVTATISLKGVYGDGLDPEELVQKLTDAVERETRILQAGGFLVEDCTVRVSAPPSLDRRTGIEDQPGGLQPTGQRRRCLDCHEPLSHGHLEACRYNGVVLTLQSGLYDD